ncbi:hypothetical protein ACSBR1_039534 [Camellia fascicularis]
MNESKIEVFDICTLQIFSPHIYAVSITIHIILGFMLLALIWRFDFPPFMVLIIAIVNDGLTMLSRRCMSTMLNQGLHFHFVGADGNFNVVKCGYLVYWYGYWMRLLDVSE